MTAEQTALDHEAAARRRAAASKDNTHAGEAMQQLPEVHNPTPKRRWGLGRFALSGNVALGY